MRREQNGITKESEEVLQSIGATEDRVQRIRILQAANDLYYLDGISSEILGQALARNAELNEWHFDD